MRTILTLLFLLISFSCSASGRTLDSLLGDGQLPFSVLHSAIYYGHSVPFDRLAWSLSYELTGKRIEQIDSEDGRQSLLIYEALPELRRRIIEAGLLEGVVLAQFDATFSARTLYGDSHIGVRGLRYVRNDGSGGGRLTVIGRDEVVRGIGFSGIPFDIVDGGMIRKEELDRCKASGCEYLPLRSVESSELVVCASRENGKARRRGEVEPFAFYAELAVVGVVPSKRIPSFGGFRVALRLDGIRVSGDLSSCPG